MPGQPTRSRALKLLLVLAVLALLFVLRHRIHFDWAALGRQLRHVSSAWIVLGTAVLLTNYLLRAIRWAVLTRPLLPAGVRLRSAELIAPQLIGFTAVALIGRLADLTRPFLIARRLALPVASQVAIYSVERAFDLSAAATLFSLTLALAPPGLPHHRDYVHAGLASLAGILVLATVAVALRFRSRQLATLTSRLLHPISPKLAAALSERLVDFGQGFHALSTFPQFLSAFALSLLMWAGIAFAYFASARAFQAEPTLARLPLTGVVLIMASSMGGSLLQLPIIGWFTTAGVIATALHTLLDVPVEAAAACGLVAFAVTNLTVIPFGLAVARSTGTSLRATVQTSQASDPAKLPA